MLKYSYMLNLIFLGFGFDALIIKLSNFLLMLDRPTPLILDIMEGDIIPIPRPLPERADGWPSASSKPPKVSPSKNDP